MRARASSRIRAVGRSRRRTTRCAQTTGDVVAFTDANSTWAPDALRKLVRVFADPDVAYVCGRLNVQADDGRNKEGLYWRYELGVRGAESRVDSVTGGNGSIYAVRRSDYVEVDPRFGHDLSLPYLMVQRGRRAVYEPEANAFEKATPTTEDEYRRKVQDVRALLGDRGGGQDAPTVAPVVLGRDRFASASALRERRPPSRACWERTLRCSVTAPCTR